VSRGRLANTPELREQRHALVDSLKNFLEGKRESRAFARAGRVEVFERLFDEGDEGSLDRRVPVHGLLSAQDARQTQEVARRELSRQPPFRSIFSPLPGIFLRRVHVDLDAGPRRPGRPDQDVDVTARGDGGDGLADRRFRRGIFVAQLHGHVEKTVIYAAHDDRGLRPVGKGGRRAAESGHGLHPLLSAFAASRGASKA